MIYDRSTIAVVVFLAFVGLVLGIAMPASLAGWFTAVAISLQ